MRRLGTLLIVLTIAGCGESEREVARSTPPVWTEHPLPERGATVALPRGWTLAGESLTPYLANPQEVFSAASFPLQHRETECAQMPSALNDLGPAGVFVSVQERDRETPGGDYPSRPARFEPHAEPSEVECAPDPGDLHWYSFADGGRRFYGMVAYGPAATPEARAQGFEVLSRAVYDAAAGPN